MRGIRSSNWILGANESLMAGLLAIDNVVAGFNSHEEFNAALSAFKVLGGGFPDELTVVCYAKDVEWRNHARPGYTTGGNRRM